MASGVATGKVKIRPLSFATVADCRAEVERLAAAAAQGRVKMLGNWSLGTNFGHVAFFIEAIDEDKGIKTPWFMKLIGPVMKGKMLRGPMPQGVRIPGLKSGTLGDEPCELDVGLARLRRALDRLERGGFPARHPVFGKMSQQEWVTLHLRHAELHLGFAEVG